MMGKFTCTRPAEPCPSIVYQRHVKDVLLKNPQASMKFLNALLNQLNWAFSEFIGMVQEIHNISSRPERVFIESRQLKICATCFDLATSLLRVLEMIATVAPNIFNDPSHPSSENLLSRLCQVYTYLRTLKTYIYIYIYISFNTYVSIHIIFTVTLPSVK